MRVYYNYIDNWYRFCEIMTFNLWLYCFFLSYLYLFNEVIEFDKNQSVSVTIDHYFIY